MPEKKSRSQTSVASKCGVQGECGLISVLTQVCGTCWNTREPYASPFSIKGCTGTFWLPGIQCNCSSNLRQIFKKSDLFLQHEAPENL